MSTRTIAVGYTCTRAHQINQNYKKSTIFNQSVHAQIFEKISDTGKLSKIVFPDDRVTCSMQFSTYSLRRCTQATPRGDAQATLIDETQAKLSKSDDNSYTEQYFLTLNSGFTIGRFFVGFEVASNYTQSATVSTNH